MYKPVRVVVVNNNRVFPNNILLIGNGVLCYVNNRFTLISAQYFSVDVVNAANKNAQNGQNYCRFYNCNNGLIYDVIGRAARIFSSLLGCSSIAFCENSTIICNGLNGTTTIGNLTVDHKKKKSSLKYNAK